MLIENRLRRIEKAIVMVGEEIDRLTRTVMELDARLSPMLGAKIDLVPTPVTPSGAPAPAPGTTSVVFLPTGVD